MTLHATRDGQSITIHGNTGVDVAVRNSHVERVGITEAAQHAEYFHGQLGKLLADAKAERAPEVDGEAAAAGTAGE